MKYIPILFNQEMVRATLVSKTNTRRVITPKNSAVGVGKVDWTKFCWDGSQVYKDTCQHGHTDLHQAPLPWADGSSIEQYLHVPYAWEDDMTIYRVYPKYEVGDRLWVKETWDYIFGSDGDHVIYKADKESLEWFNQRKKDGSKITWRPSIFMPRWASRITLEITEVRAEQIRSITAQDVIKEGISFTHKPIYAFSHLWDSINGKKKGCSWTDNPWVWVIGFKRIYKCPECGKDMESDHNSAQCHNCQTLYPLSYLREV